MGTRGPVPKRADQRRRRNKTDGGIFTAPGAGTVAVPDADEAWYPIAQEWYRSLAESGQSQFFEPSDWQFARLLAELVTRALTTDRLNGQLVATILSGMSELLTTEGARRRVRIELERNTGPDEHATRAHGTVTDIRKRLGA